ncbi:hypothetical protein B0A54_06962 [Friedmanniomyces endolithicus]|uniref:Riboflavin kinase n=1 Tax=Friedmanniomyces endolithicus TaxID=329885 RepID=A0A4U0V2Q9_9PEZI|nr:hypothetical protein B0A54_06962 [Friedmanniomyces endolithicus]
MSNQHDSPRPLVTGPDDGPRPPYPLRLDGKVIKGFGRGSSELAIPTANIPLSGLSVGGHEDVESGVYYGWAGLSPSKATHQHPPQTQSFKYSHLSSPLQETLSSIATEGGASEKGAVHMNLSILGFIRPELDYVSKEKLIEDIKTDIEVSGRSLAREPYAKLRRDPYLLEFEGKGDEAT